MKCFKFIIVMFLASCASKDKATIHHMPSPAGMGSSLPNLYSNSDKTILSWIGKVNDSIAQLNYSYLVAGIWQEPKTIVRGTDWFVNWADFPMISENNGNLISHVLRKSSKATFSYDINLNFLPKGESRWKTGMPLHTDSTKTEHGFVSTIPYKENSFFITWLDGRNTMGDGHEHGHEGDMNIRAAVVSSEGIVSHEALLDERTCSCCQTTAAMTKNGPVVLYRDRSDEEIRDIVITRMVDGHWTTPKAIYNDGWKIMGCPVNGPKSAAAGNDLVVAWFTGANDTPEVKVAFSSNGGENFDAPILVSNLDVIGRVDILMVDGENTIVSWMETTEMEAHIKAVKINKSGKKSTPIVVSRLDGSRKTGFPQMEKVGDKVYFAWTDVTNEETSISTAYVLLEMF